MSVKQALFAAYGDQIERAMDAQIKLLETKIKNSPKQTQVTSTSVAKNKDAIEEPGTISDSYLVNLAKRFGL